MKSSKAPRISFPCDCISSTPACEEPWARVAKEGMFKDGTKEEILNSLAWTPQTIAQLARITNLAQPTVFRHVSDLARHHLVREVDSEQREYDFERYYTTNFPVIAKEDQELFEDEIHALAGKMASAFLKRRSSLRKRFAASRAASEGWLFDEVAQYILHAAQRQARARLEERGEIARSFSAKGLDFAFWGTEERK